MVQGLRWMPRVVAVWSVLVLLAACGEDSPAEDDSDAAARDTVANFFAALGDSDAEQACALSTERGQQKTVVIFNRLAEQPGASLGAGNFTDCSDAIGSIVERLDEVDPEAAEAPRNFAEGIRSGEGDVEVDVSLGEAKGLVTLSGGDGELVMPIGVEWEGERWLISDPTVPLFGVGRNAGG